MGFFDKLKDEAEAKGLDFLVIGGLAINFYGYSRETADLDLLVDRERRDDWKEMLLEAGYSIEHDADNFLQLVPPGGRQWPIDLMFVSPNTFGPMWQKSREVSIYGVCLRLPCLEHLIALKLHALKNTRAHRFLKDFQDLEGMIRVNHLHLAASKTRQLFLRYGALELYENSSEPAPTNDPKAGLPAATQFQEGQGNGAGDEEPKLEFPIEPDFVSRPPRLDPQVMLERCARNMPYRNARPGESRRRLAEKIPEEFAL